jgi:hypothetical protein
LFAGLLARTAVWTGLFAGLAAWLVYIGGSLGHHLQACLHD